MTLWITLLTCIPLQAQQILESYFGGREYHLVDFQYKQNFIIVDVLFGGILPLKFILDTGSEHTLLFDRIIADILGIQVEQKPLHIKGSDYTQEVLAYVARKVKIKLGDTPVRQEDIIVLQNDFTYLSLLIGQRIDGILGGAFFKNTILRINYEKQFLKIFNPNKFFDPMDNYTSFPINIFKNRPYLKINVMTAPNRTNQLNLLMDTGAALSLLLYTGTKTGVSLPEETIPGHLGVGLGGNVYGFLGRTKQLALDKYTFDHLVTNFQKLPETDSLFVRPFRDGLIGNMIWDRFTVQINYVHGTLSLLAHKSWDRSFDLDRSGLSIIVFGKNLSKYLVQDVIPNSPADEAGIQQGDVIKKLSWLPGWMLSLDGIQKRLKGHSGKKVKITILRNGKKLKKYIILRDLI